MFRNDSSRKHYQEAYLSIYRDILSDENMKDWRLYKMVGMMIFIYLV